MAAPELMPPRGISTQNFEPVRFDAEAVERGGRVGSVSLGWPLWTAQWTLSRNITPDMSDEWRAWLLRRRGAQRPFLAMDRERLYPKAYRSGFAGLVIAGTATGFAGHLASWSQAIDGDGNAALTLTGLPANFPFTLGDYIGFRWDAAGSAIGSFDRRSIVRAVGSVNANGAGVAVVSVEPPVNIQVVPNYAIAYLNEPSCRMRILSGETQLAPLDRRLKVAGGTITAIEDLRP